MTKIISGASWAAISSHPLFASVAIPFAIFLLEKLIELCKEKYNERQKADDIMEINAFLTANNV